jgi:hypothetical protein
MVVICVVATSTLLMAAVMVGAAPGLASAARPGRGGLL